MYAFSILLNSWSLERFISRLRLCVTVFQSPTVDEPVYSSYEQLMQIMRELPNEENESDESPLLTDHNLLSDDFSEDTSEEREVYMEASRPFLPYIMGRISNVHISGNSDGKSNNLFQFGWLNTMERKWLSLTPFWSCILRGIILHSFNWQLTLSSIK